MTNERFSKSQELHHNWAVGAFMELKGREAYLKSTAKVPALYDGLRTITVSYPLITLQRF